MSNPVSVEISAALLERVKLTGHPRLLRLVLDNEARDVLREVEIESLKVTQAPEMTKGGAA